MASCKWKITNITQGTVELGFRRDPLGVGECVYLSGELPDKLKFYKGARLVTIEAIADDLEQVREEVSSAYPVKVKKKYQS